MIFVKESLLALVLVIHVSRMGLVDALPQRELMRDGPSQRHDEAPHGGRKLPPGSDLGRGPTFQGQISAGGFPSKDAAMGAMSGGGSAQRDRKVEGEEGRGEGDEQARRKRVFGQLLSTLKESEKSRRLNRGDVQRQQHQAAAAAAADGQMRMLLREGTDGVLPSLVHMSQRRKDEGDKEALEGDDDHEDDDEEEDEEEKETDEESSEEEGGKAGGGSEERQEIEKMLRQSHQNDIRTFVSTLQKAFGIMGPDFLGHLLTSMIYLFKNDHELSELLGLFQEYIHTAAEESPEKLEVVARELRSRLTDGTKRKIAMELLRILGSLNEPDRENFNKVLELLKSVDSLDGVMMIPGQAPSHAGEKKLGFLMKMVSTKYGRRTLFRSLSDLFNQYDPPDIVDWVIKSRVWNLISDMTTSDIVTIAKGFYSKLTDEGMAKLVDVKILLEKRLDPKGRQRLQRVEDLMLKVMQKDASARIEKIQKGKVQLDGAGTGAKDPRNNYGPINEPVNVETVGKEHEESGESKTKSKREAGSGYGNKSEEEDDDDEPKGLKKAAIELRKKQKAFALKMQKNEEERQKILKRLSGDPSRQKRDAQQKEDDDDVRRGPDMSENAEDKSSAREEDSKRLEKNSVGREKVARMERDVAKQESHKQEGSVKEGGKGEEKSSGVNHKREPGGNEDREGLKKSMRSSSDDKKSDRLKRETKEGSEPGEGKMKERNGDGKEQSHVPKDKLMKSSDGKKDASRNKREAEKEEEQDGRPRKGSGKKGHVEREETGKSKQGGATNRAGADGQSRSKRSPMELSKSGSRRAEEEGADRDDDKRKEDRGPRRARLADHGSARNKREEFLRNDREDMGIGAKSRSRGESGRELGREVVRRAAFSRDGDDGGGGGGRRGSGGADAAMEGGGRRKAKEDPMAVAKSMVAMMNKQMERRAERKERKERRHGAREEREAPPEKKQGRKKEREQPAARKGDGGGGGGGGGGALKRLFAWARGKGNKD